MLKILKKNYKNPGANTCPYAAAHNWRRLLRALSNQGASSGGILAKRRGPRVTVGGDLLAAMRVPMEPVHFEHLRGLAVLDVLATWRDHGAGLGPDQYAEKLAMLCPRSQCAPLSACRLRLTMSPRCPEFISLKDSVLCRYCSAVEGTDIKPFIQSGSNETS